MEIILETIIILIFRYPGAAVRWGFSRLWNSKKSFIEFTKDEPYINATIGILILVGIILILQPWY